MPAEQSTVGRAGSAGGIVLEKGATKKEAVKSNAASTSTSTPTAAPKKQAEKVTTPSAVAKEKDAADATGPNRQRRRPRKLNRDAPTDDAPSASMTTASAAAASTPAQAAELEALKARVRGLEAKVEELYSSAEVRNRSPRRRGKGRKTSSTRSIPSLKSLTSDAAEQEKGEGEEEADEELVRAEEELASARRDLEVFQPHGRSRPQAKRATSSASDGVEEVPRAADEELYDDQGRQVTLTGSYRIPLPKSLDLKDVKTIQSGVSAAQKVAGAFLEQRRANRAAAAAANPTPTATQQAKPKAGRKASGMEVTRETGTGTEVKGWGEWFGGYSMAISRAVKSIEAEAVVESQRGARAAMTGWGSAVGKVRKSRGRR